MKRLLFLAALFLFSSVSAGREVIKGDAASIQQIVDLSKSFTQKTQGCDPSTVQMERYTKDDGSNVKLSDFVWSYIQQNSIESDITLMRLGENADYIQIYVSGTAKYYPNYALIQQIGNKAIFYDTCSFKE